MQFIKSHMSKLFASTQYPFENRKFNTFDVEFETTSKVLTQSPHTQITHNSVIHTMGKYETINNEPHILTMTVCVRPTSDVSIQFDDVNKCVILTSTPNGFIQKEGRACLHHTETIEMIDTTKYVYFIVNE